MTFNIKANITVNLDTYPIYIFKNDVTGDNLYINDQTYMEIYREI